MQRKIAAHARPAHGNAPGVHLGIGAQVAQRSVQIIDRARVEAALAGPMPPPVEGQGDKTRLSGLAGEGEMMLLATGKPVANDQPRRRPDGGRGPADAPGQRQPIALQAHLFNLWLESPHPAPFVPSLPLFYYYVP